MIKRSFVFVVGLTWICLGVTPSLAAGPVSIQISGDGQKMNVTKFPATFPNMLSVKSSVKTLGLSNLVWSVDAGDNSAQCKVTPVVDALSPMQSTISVTAFAAGTCTVNAIGPSNIVGTLPLRESFRLSATTPPPAYVAKIVFGNNQTAVWPANSQLQTGGEAYFSGMEVQIVDPAGHPVPNVQVMWECLMPNRAMHCDMKIPEVGGLISQNAEMTFTDSSGKTDLPMFILSPSGAQSPLVITNGNGPLTITVDSIKGLFAPVVFNLTVK
jgi:hypothetical protein